VNLIEIINPTQEYKVEVALYKLAKLNAVTEIAASILVPLAIALGLYKTLDSHRLMIWLLLMLFSAITAAITFWVLNLPNKQNDPTPARLRLWRHANLLSLIVAGIGWGSIGTLFDAVHSTQNDILLLSYLGVMSAGGNASGAHSFRLYFIVVACTLVFMSFSLPIGFGNYALPIGMLLALYAGFVAKVSFNTQKTIMRTIELQLLNEQLLQEKAIATQMAEREQIYHDLHDDVGAKLLGLAISAQRANLTHEADMARSALQDLRDVVSRSAYAETPLDDLIADLRVETRQRLDATDLKFVWDYPEHENKLMVSAAAALHLSRILREAVTNVLRHAEAKSLIVMIQIQRDELIFEVEDDGKGCPVDKLRPHRGMVGMNTRAAALNGALSWSTVHPHGCRVNLSVPLASLPPPETRG
jgi:signal transduction histidine kinase